MSKRIFTKDQIEELLKNKWIAKCSDKSIGYSKAFKILAVKQFNEQGFSAARIFKEAGFDLNVIGLNVPKAQLRAWSKIHQTKGLAGFKEDGRGRTKSGKRGRPKTKGITDADRIKRLEIENAYLKAKYDFLVKLRAQRKS